MLQIDHAIARIAAQGRSRSRSELDGTSAAEWDAQTGYRAQRLTVGQLKDKIVAEQERQEAIRRRRRRVQPAPVPAPGRILRLIKRKKQNLAQTRAALAACVPLYEAQQRGGGASVRIGDAIVRAVEDGKWNYDRYGRTYHSRYGGVWEVQERRVELLQVSRVGALEVVRTVWIDGFRGHWLIRAIAELYNLPKVRVPRALKPVQMGDYFALEQVRSVAGVQIYRRPLAGETVDYCAVAGATTYHAATPREAIVGLRHKLQQARAMEARRVARDGEVLTAQHGFRLGFCQAGIRAFCDANDLDFGSTYTRGELRERVALRKHHNHRHWRSELAQMGLL